MPTTREGRIVRLSAKRCDAVPDLSLGAGWRTVWEVAKFGDYTDLTASKQALSNYRVGNKKLHLSAQHAEIFSLTLKVKDHFLQKTLVFPVAK